MIRDKSQPKKPRNMLLKGEFCSLRFLQDKAQILLLHSMKLLKNLLVLILIQLVKVKTKTLGSHLIKELLILMTLKETKDKKLRERRKHAIADSATEEDKALVELLL